MNVPPPVPPQAPQVTQPPRIPPLQPHPRQAPTSQATIRSKVAILLTSLSFFGALFLMLVFFVSANPPREQPKSMFEPTAEERRAAMAMPPDQANMVAIVRGAHRAYKAASNQLQAGAARPNRASELCNSLRGTIARDWKGTVSKLTTNSDGRGVLTITIADDIEIATWNNAVSDIPYKTLIEPNSALYRSALELAEGMKVRFSGEFVRSEVDCLLESSLTMNGSMTSPKFILRFSDIAPL